MLRRNAMAISGLIVGSLLCGNSFAGIKLQSTKVPPVVAYSDIYGTRHEIVLQETHAVSGYVAAFNYFGEMTCAWKEKAKSYICPAKGSDYEFEFFPMDAQKKSGKVIIRNSHSDGGPTQWSASAIYSIGR